MGSFYTNITLRTNDVDAVATAVRQVRRTALIAPPDGGCTVVFDEASEGQDLEVLQALAAHLSRACRCPALAILNHDDDILAYVLFEQGEAVDLYNSAPSYFESGADPDTPPAGGDADRLARAFGAADRAEEVERVLRTPGGVDDGFVFAVERHQELAAALGLPGVAVGTGFRYLEEGEYPEGLDPAALRRV